MPDGILCVLQMWEEKRLLDVKEWNCIHSRNQSSIFNCPSSPSLLNGMNAHWDLEHARWVMKPLNQPRLAFYKITRHALNRKENTFKLGFSLDFQFSLSLSFLSLSVLSLPPTPFLFLSLSLPFFFLSLSLLFLCFFFSSLPSLNKVGLFSYLEHLNFCIFFHYKNKQEH